MRQAVVLLAAWACVLGPLAPPAAAGVIVHRVEADADADDDREPVADITAAPDPTAGLRPLDLGRTFARPDIASTPTPFHTVPAPPAVLLVAVGGLLVAVVARLRRDDHDDNPLLPA